REDLMTISFGNLAGGRSGSVAVTVTGSLPVTDGVCEMRIPTTTAPRYTSGTPTGRDWYGENDTDEVPDASRMNVGWSDQGPRVTMTVNVTEPGTLVQVPEGTIRDGQVWHLDRSAGSGADEVFTWPAPEATVAYL